MPAYRPLGEEIVSPSVYNIRAHAEPEKALKTAPPVELGTVPAPAEESFAIEPVSATATPARPFQPIDTGKPLNVVIRRVYTGKYPEKGIFSKKKPMLISSSIKDVTTTSAGTQAVNILK